MQCKCFDGAYLIDFEMPIQDAGADTWRLALVGVRGDERPHRKQKFDFHKICQSRGNKDVVCFTNCSTCCQRKKKEKLKEKAAGTCVLSCAAHFYKLICLRRWRRNDVAQNILQSPCQPGLHTRLPVRPRLETKTSRTNTDPRGPPPPYHPRGSSAGDCVLISPSIFRRSTGLRERFLVSEEIRRALSDSSGLSSFSLTEHVCVCFWEGIAVRLHPQVKPKLSRTGDGNFETSQRPLDF